MNKRVTSLVAGIGLVLALGGCVPEPQMIFSANKPGQTDADFERDRSACRASGSLLVGQYRDDFQNCMETKGWTRVYHH
jgi:hypothetical protein